MDPIKTSARTSDGGGDPPAKRQRLFFTDAEDDEVMEAAAPEVKGKGKLQESGSKSASAPAAQVKKAKDEDLDMMIVSPTAFNKGVAAKQKSKFKFIGDFVTQGWCTTKTDKIITPGCKITLEREMPVPTNNSKKGRPSKKEDIIVRFKNMKGSEVGRLSGQSASWVARILDQKLGKFEGSVVDCPDKLSIGCDVLLSIRAYLNTGPAFQISPIAAQSPSPSVLKNGTNLKSKSAAPSKKTVFNDAQETDTEKQLRERKTSLNRMFDQVSLYPTRSNSLLESHKAGGALDSKRSLLEHYDGAAERKLKKEMEAKKVKDEGANDDAEDMSEDQVNSVYSKAVRNDINLPEMEPSPSFKLDLRPYQKQALKWLATMEGGEDDARDAMPMHPLWEEYTFPADDESQQNPSPFYYNPYSGELSLDFPKASRRCRGGILADEMVHHLSFQADCDRLQVEWFRVILDEAHVIKSRNTKNAKACYAIQAKRRWCVTGTPIVNRLEDLYSLLHFIRLEPWGNFSFFRTFVTVPFQKKDPKAIEIIQVILESILLRREKKMKDKDGNPIVTLPEKHISDEYLELTPKERVIYDKVFKFAKSKFLGYAKAGTVSKNYTAIFAVLMRLRQAVLHPMLVLKKIKNPNDTDTEDEDSAAFAKGDIEEDIKELIAKYTAGAEDEDSVAYATQVLNKLLEEQSEGKETEEEEECPLCLSEFVDPVLFPRCMHKGCKSCVIEYLQDLDLRDQDGKCPVCGKGPVRVADLLEIVRDEPAPSLAKRERTVTPSPTNKQTQDAGPTQATQFSVKDDDPKDEDYVPTQTQDVDQTQARPSGTGVFLRRNDFVSSTKLDALIRHLKALRQSEPKFKVVVFSQFTSFLDLIERVLNRDRFHYVRFDGSLPQKRREVVLRGFKKSTSSCIMLVSLKSGGQGLNLIEANRVYMMDCWWNEAVENQAIDRVHRFGQEREVYVTRFLIKQSVEEKMIQIQKRKTAIVNAVAGPSVEDFDLIFGS